MIEAKNLFYIWIYFNWINNSYIFIIVLLQLLRLLLNFPPLPSHFLGHQHFIRHFLLPRHLLHLHFRFHLVIPPLLILHYYLLLHSLHLPNSLLPDLPIPHPYLHLHLHSLPHFLNHYLIFPNSDFQITIYSKYFKRNS